MSFKLCIIGAGSVGFTRKLCADILLVPDLEAGNMLAKTLTFLGGADAGGIVLGVRVPIVLTSRADSGAARMASCAIAVLQANRT